MAFEKTKLIGGLIAGACAGNVTSHILEELTARGTKIVCAPGTSVLITDISAEPGLRIKRGHVEKAVIAVGVFVISGVVASVVAKSVTKELDDIEQLIREIGKDNDEILRGVTGRAKEA